MFTVVSAAIRRYDRQVTKRLTVVLLCWVTVLSMGVIAGQGRADAARCPDVEGIFARGTAETAPPVGLTGLAFSTELRRLMPGRSVNVWGVPYKASARFSDRRYVAQTAIDGINMIQRRMERIASACPRTKIVLGGYSQGAVITTYATSSTPVRLPARYERELTGLPPVLPTSVAGHVAAVVLLGAPSDRWMRDIGTPPLRVGTAYRGKTYRYCIPGDTICNGTKVGQPNALHVLYGPGPVSVAAARYAAQRIR